MRDSALGPADIARALDGDRGAMRALVTALRPVVQAEVAWTLVRSARATGSRDPRQEVADFTQDVFVALISDGGRMLRTWDPQRGRGLEGYVRLIARQQVWAILRTGRRSPWTEDPTAAIGLERALRPAASHEHRVLSAQTLRRLVERLRVRMSTRGMLLFERLYVEERSVEEVCAELDMTRDAIYAWRLRLKRHVHAAAAELESEPGS